MESYWNIEIPYTKVTETVITLSNVQQVMHFFPTQVMTDMDLLLFYWSNMMLVISCLEYCKVSCRESISDDMAIQPIPTKSSNQNYFHI